MASMRKFDATNFGVNTQEGCLLKTYEPFWKQNHKYRSVLEEFYKELAVIRPFTPSLFKVTEIGYLLKCFYRLHNNKKYEDAMFYSFGFNGYLDNLRGAFENLEKNKLGLSVFDTKNKTRIENEFYPPLLNKDPVKNTCNLTKNMIITGPNGSGKTTMLKTTMINVIFSQQLGAGFYSSCTLNPYTHIFSYLNIPDTSSYDSLFQAEARRCKVILDDIQNYPEKDGYRHFYIFDEIFSGTSPTQAEKLIYHYLSYLCKRDNVDFCLTSHHIKACKQLKKNAKIQNYKMIVNELDDHQIGYTYQMKKGISTVEGSISVIKQMKYPEELVDDICKKT
jgi:DNA mismatch repair ATPase MutS